MTNFDKTSNNVKLANNIKELRKVSNLKQAELAQQLNVSQQTVAAWETGRTIPGSDTLGILADYFQVTTDYLLGRSNSANETENNLLVSFRKRTAGMTPEEKKKFQRSLNGLMDAAKELNREN